MELRYAGEDKLFVPLERLDLVQKYTGGATPALDKLGGTTWEKAKSRVKKAMRDMAEELLKLYAARKAVAGHAFSPDSHWQQEFADAFEYEPHAGSADGHRGHHARHGIADADGSPALRRRRLRQDRSRDARGVQGRHRRQAGRVSRADDGARVSARADAARSASPDSRSRIDMISRFRSKQEQKELLADLAAGQVDIIVGTHRLLSKDVSFRDLGLLVVDEEQRFGVAHKEKLKQLRKKVDVLTMTATPIPRTLNMSLVGIRDMSVIETPPRDRLAIQTQVVKFDTDVDRRARFAPRSSAAARCIFVHNRVESIYSMGNLSRGSCPRRSRGRRTARWARTSSSA